MPYVLNPFTGELDATNGPATTTKSGLLSSADKVKLNATDTRSTNLGLILAMTTIPPSF